MNDHPCSSPRPGGWKGERDQRRIRAGAGGHHDELTAGARAVGHRRAGDASRERQLPELAPGREIERVKGTVVATDEHETTAGGQHARGAWRAESIGQGHAPESWMVP